MSLANRISGYVQSLRFPFLVLLTGLVFIGDVIVPDVIPFVDEIILGLVLALLARLRKPRKKQDKDPSGGGSAAE